MIGVMNIFWQNVRELSEELGVKPETSRKWQTKRTIPPKWHHLLLSAAKGTRVELSWNDLRNPPGRDVSE